ncbi:hypothetical protein [Nucisporomicrobium flavum]|uniref:hypothetical protein n=1 Tax=Nucisporomicrobium flavum TaxID=2785915 RepID=UPI0018F373BF|nr:hypothetical protein [Nucisporomicrobium flavum]
MAPPLGSNAQRWIRIEDLLHLSMRFGSGKAASAETCNFRLQLLMLFDVQCWHNPGTPVRNPRNIVRRADHRYAGWCEFRLPMFLPLLAHQVSELQGLRASGQMPPVQEFLVDRRTFGSPRASRGWNGLRQDRHAPRPV